MRTQTPPTLRWLLNERAALAGTLETVKVRLPRQKAYLERLQKAIVTTTTRIAASERLLADTQSRLQALDATVGLVDERVNPAALGPVQVWSGRYGPKGALKAFIVEYLRAAAPIPVSTPLLVDAVITRFNLVMEDRAHRSRFGGRIAEYVRRLVRQGLVRPLHSGSHQHIPGLWQWVGDSTPTLAQLHELAAASEAARNEHAAHEDGP